MRNGKLLVRYKKKKPLIAQILRLKFPLIVDKKVIMVWGNRIYTENILPNDLVIHEKVHVEQQKYSKLWGLLWWIRYTFSAPFRLKQEIAAYRKQYQFFCDVNRNHKKQQEFLKRIAWDVSGPMYNRLIGFNQAEYLISKKNN